MTSTSASRKRLSIMSKKKRSNKRKYKHESTGDYCTCAAYVAEIMCKKKAEFSNKGSLSFKFWSKPPWDWTFKRQMIAANKILKDHRISETALVKAINSKEFGTIFSLNHPKAMTIIKKYQLMEDNKSNQEQKIDHKKEAKHRDKRFGKKKNIFKRLKDIENGEEKEDD